MFYFYDRYTEHVNKKRRKNEFSIIARVLINSIDVQYNLDDKIAGTKCMQ